MGTVLFDELPVALRCAVEAHTGPVTAFERAPAGNHARLAGAAHTDGGRVFLKGVPLMPGEAYGGGEAWSLRNEAAVLPYVPTLGPELLFQIEAGGWLVLGFEHLEGRHARFHPGSPDLDLVAGVVEALADIECPDVVLLRVEDRYKAADPAAAAFAGRALLHCDLNPSNILITTGGARVVDWAFTSRGAAWLEAGFMLPWLVRDGHAPAEAEAWLARFPAWRAADPRDIDLFAGLLATAWTRRDTPDAEPWVAEYAGIARAWAGHRGRLQPTAA